MSSPTPPPPLPDPDDDLPRRAPRRRSAAPSSSRDAARRHPSAWSRLSPRAWAILVAVVAIVLVLIIGAVAGGSGKEKKSEIKTDSAVSALQSLLDGVDKDTALGSCPFGSVASIAGDVRGEVKVSGVVTAGMHKIVIGGKEK
ncbi:MAG: hypothetical protein JWM12_1213, partial [Ilumatobacteraceae bacterium]|nr:hypothetical protein [Ilumatobacteraceae bacterium]